MNLTKFWSNPPWPALLWGLKTKDPPPVDWPMVSTAGTPYLDSSRPCHWRGKHPAPRAPHACDPPLLTSLDFFDASWRNWVIPSYHRSPKPKNEESWGIWSSHVFWNSMLEKRLCWPILPPQMAAWIKANHRERTFKVMKSSWNSPVWNAIETNVSKVWLVIQSTEYCISLMQVSTEAGVAQPLALWNVPMQRVDNVQAFTATKGRFHAIADRHDVHHVASGYGGLIHLPALWCQNHLSQLLLIQHVPCQARARTVQQ